MNYLSTIAWHGLNILMFRHKGEGLESVTKSNALSVAAIATLMTAVALCFESKDILSALISLTVYVGFLVLFFKAWPAHRVAGVFCLFFVYAFIRIFIATVFPDWNTSQNMLFILWESIAMMVYITRAK